MVNCCIVPGCKTGYKKERDKRKQEGLPYPSLFTVPKNEDLFQKWKLAIPTGDKELKKTDRICELHFLREEISKHHVLIINGKEELIEKFKPSLKKDAIPSVFSTCPFYSEINKRKEPPGSLPLSKKMRNNYTEQDVIIEETHEQFTLNDLIKNLSDVNKPHKLWSVSSHEDFIICVKWDYRVMPQFTCQPERQIIINADLGVTIMYYGSVVTSMPPGIIKSIHDFSRLLTEVDKFVI